MHIWASAFEGESVSVTDLLADSLALTSSATLDGLTAQGCVHDGRGRLGRHFLRSAHSNRHRHRSHAKWLLKHLGLLGHPAVGEAKKATFPVADKIMYRCDRQTQFRNFEDMFSLTSFSKKKPQLALADADHITQHFALEHWRQTGSSATALYYAALVPLADTDARYDSDSDLFRLTQDVLAAPSLSTSPALALAVDAAGFQFQITEDETAGLTRSGAAQVAIVPEDGLSRCTLFRVNHWYPSRMKQVQGNFQASLCAKDVAVSLYAIAELDSDTQVLRTTGVPEGCRAELSSSSGSLVFFVSLLCRLFAHKFQIRLC